MNQTTYTHCPECLLRGDLDTRLVYDGTDHNKLLCPACGEKYSVTSMFFRFMETAVKLAEEKKRDAKENRREHAAA